MNGMDTFAGLAGVADLATWAECPPEIRARALRALASRARDADDARLLMEALGLIGTPVRTHAPRRRARSDVIRSVGTAGAGGERA